MNNYLPTLISVGDKRKSKNGRVATVINFVLRVENGKEDGSVIVYSYGDGCEYTADADDFVRWFPYVVSLAGKWRNLDNEEICQSLAQDGADRTDTEYIEAYATIYRRKYGFDWKR